MNTRQQASELSQKTFAELAKARTFLSMASDSALDVLALLEPADEVDEDISMLTRLADQMRSEEQPRPDVQAALTAVDDRLKQALDGLDEAREHLRQGALTIAACRQNVTDIEKLYADEPADPATEAGADTGLLRSRLDSFEEVVQTSTAKLDTATQQVGLAYTSIEALRRLPARTGDREATATLIKDVDGDIEHYGAEASTALKDSAREFTSASDQAYAAAKVANKVGRAALAGLNPTDTSEQRPQAAASGEDHRPRADGSGRDRSLGR